MGTSYFALLHGTVNPERRSIRATVTAATTWAGVVWGERFAPLARWRWIALVVLLLLVTVVRQDGLEVLVLAGVDALVVPIDRFELHHE